MAYSSQLGKQTVPTPSEILARNRAKRNVVVEPKPVVKPTPQPIFDVLNQTLQPIKVTKSGKVTKVKAKPTRQYEQYLDMTVNKVSSMSREELGKINRKLITQANRRIKTLQEKGFESWGYGKRKLFTPLSDKATLSSQIKQYNQLNRLLTSETSTLRGARQNQKRLTQKLGLKVDQMTQDDWTNLGDIISRLQSLGVYQTSYDSDTVFKDFGDAVKMEFNTVDDIYDYLKNVKGYRI